jgi:hypothetical protein
MVHYSSVRNLRGAGALAKGFVCSTPSFGSILSQQEQERCSIRIERRQELRLEEIRLAKLNELLPRGLEVLEHDRRLDSVLIPVSLGPVPAVRLRWFDKYLYGRLLYEAGISGYCQVTLTDIAKELEVSIDSIARAVERLSAEGLIFRKRLRRASLIVFLESPLLHRSLPNPDRGPSATLRTDWESAAVRIQTLQPCGAVSATTRPEEGPCTSNLSRESVRKDLREYPYSQRLLGTPDDVIVDRVIAAAIDRDRLHAALRAMHRAKAAPSQSWAWFPKVIADYIQNRLPPRRVGAP